MKFEVTNHGMDGWPESIPCEPGRYDFDLDVIEEELRTDFVTERRKQAIKKFEAAGRDTTIARARPLGFNLYQLPVGSILRRVE